MGQTHMPEKQVLVREEQHFPCTHSTSTTCVNNSAIMNPEYIAIAIHMCPTV